jgi:hypothetical protein
MHVPGAGDRVAPQAGVGPEVIGVARVVERHPMPLRVDEVDRAPGARGVRYVVEAETLRRKTVADEPALGVVPDDVDEVRGETEVVTAQRDAGARVAHHRVDRGHDVRVGERHGECLDPHDDVDPGPTDDEHVGTLGGSRHGRVTPRMPRHISSVVPSPHTT